MVKERKDKFETIHSEHAIAYQKSKAEKALDKAKKLEQNQRNLGKKYVKINSKTRVLR